MEAGAATGQPPMNQVVMNQVFGPLIEREGVTLLPVVRVRRWGAPRAVGAWVVRDGKAEWQPAFDLTRVIITGNALGLVALILFRPRISRRPPAG